MSTATTRILQTAPENDGAIGVSAAVVLQFGEPRMGVMQHRRRCELIYSVRPVQGLLWSALPLLLPKFLKGFDHCVYSLLDY